MLDGRRVLTAGLYSVTRKYKPLQLRALCATVGYLN
jgi:hypothetical protein